jgi:hypothetical protein
MLGSQICQGFQGELSYKPIEQKNKKVENQGSSNDGIKELAQLIKQMEVNQANHIKANGD